MRCGNDPTIRISDRDQETISNFAQFLAKRVPNDPRDWTTKDMRTVADYYCGERDPEIQQMGYQLRMNAAVAEGKRMRKLMGWGQ